MGHCPSDFMIAKGLLCMCLFMVSEVPSGAVIPLVINSVFPGLFIIETYVMLGSIAN